MLYESCYYLRSLRVVYLINAALMLLIAMLALVFFSLPYFNERSLNVVCPKLKRRVEKTIALDLKAFPASPLALEESDQQFPFIDLKDEVLFLGTNKRPDADPSDPILNVKFKGSKESSIIRSDELVFLTYNQGYMEVADHETPLMLCAQLQGDQLKLDAHLNLDGSSRQLSWSAAPACLPKRLSSQSPLLKAVDRLKHMKVYGPDQLIKIYGGSEFSDKKGVLRLETSTGMEPIEDGELWVWKNADWVRAKDGMQTQGFPIAQFFVRSSEQVDIKLWDAQGCDQVHFSLATQRSSPIPIKVQEVFAQLRKRTHTSVSCRLGGRARILRTGDWILKQAEGWRTLRSINEIDACVSGQLTGELFVFDGIKKMAKGWCLQGHLFDQRRVQAQKVSLSFHVAQPKKQHKDIDAYDFDAFDDDDDDDFLSGFLPGGDDD